MDLLYQVFSSELEKPCWDHRAQIGLAIARGLSYLHDECETQTIHCNIKPQNVLLDTTIQRQDCRFWASEATDERSDKNEHQCERNNELYGTGMAQKCSGNGQVDVYSFGVLLLDIICCRRHIELNRVEEEPKEVVFHNIV